MGKYLTLFTCIFLLSSCVYDDDPDKCLGEVRLEFDWIDTEPLDEEEIIDVDILSGSGERRIISTTPAGTAVSLMPNSYKLIAFEEAENVTCSDRIFTLGLNGDDSAKDPAFFNGGTTTANLPVNFNRETIVIPMRIQARKVIIRVNVFDDQAGTITKMSGKLGGITVSRDIDEGFPPVDGQRRHNALVNGSVAYDFQPTPGSDGVTLFSDEHYLLGLDGSSLQELSLEAEFSDGQPLSLTEDISHMFSYTENSVMHDYHLTNTRDAWVIELNVDIRLGWGIFITDWNAAEEEENYEAS